jgi:hypothetical protein
MFIIYSIAIGATAFAGTVFVVRAVCVAKIEREKRAFANLPREVLLVHAQMNPFYMSDYATMVIGGVSKERATEIITDRMLVDMGLIGYRKEET